MTESEVEVISHVNGLQGLSQNESQTDIQLVEMQADLMSKGNQLSRNWSELFGLLSKYQAELVIKQDQLTNQENEMKLRNREKCPPAQDAMEMEPNNTSSLSVIQRDLKMKTDLLVASQAEVLSIESALLASESKAIELQQQLTSSEESLNQKKQELAIKDGLLKKLEKQMIKEIGDLQTEAAQMKEELNMEKEAHRDTFEQLQEALKSVHGTAIKPVLGQSCNTSKPSCQEMGVDTTFNLAVPVVGVNGGCQLNIPTCNLIFSENFNPNVNTVTKPNEQETSAVGNGLSADGTPGSVEEQDITQESCEIAQWEENGTHKAKQWRRTRKRKHPQKVTNVYDATTPTQEGAKDIILIPLPKKSTQVQKNCTPTVTLTVPKIKPKPELKLKISNSIFKKPNTKQQDDGSDCSMFKEVYDNLVQSSDVLMPLSLDMKPVVGGRKVKRPFQLFSCLVCSNEFVSLNELSSHAAEHTGATVDFDLFQCEMCGKHFTDKSNYRRHRRIHSGEKPYKCQFCEVAYSRSDILKQHLVTRHSNLQVSADNPK
ncbi:zinc finger protein 236-like [Lineus longissimus]|uniref:zinc finger protein 236-like n=1 Tax=Lineus longissimus TaxID=88925 RepID=UPI00315C5AF3